MHFQPKKHFLDERKNGPFSEFPARTRFVVMLGHFFDGPAGSTKFCWKRSKIKGTDTCELTQAQKGQKQGWAPKNDPLLGKRIFLGVVQMGKL